jgi:hypothetical protein
MVIGNRVLQSCEPKEASIWSATGHYRRIGGIWLSTEEFGEFECENDAVKFCRLLVKNNPHLKCESLESMSAKLS